jgi:hypothetical protein
VAGVFPLAILKASIVVVNHRQQLRVVDQHHGMAVEVVADRILIDDILSVSEESNSAPP